MFIFEAILNSGKKHFTSWFTLASTSTKMAKALKSPAGSLLRHLALAYGEVVEMERGPTPAKHLHSIYSSEMAVLV